MLTLYCTYSDAHWHEHFIARVFATGAKYPKVCGRAKATELAQTVWDNYRLKKGAKEKRTLHV